MNNNFKKIKYFFVPVLVFLMLITGIPLDVQLNERGRIVDTMYLAMKGQVNFSDFYFGNTARAETKTIILNFTQTILTEGNTWTVPLDWDNASNTIEVIGGGGAGWTDTAGTNGAGGGGGGAYSKSVNVTLSAGATVSYNIGNGGNVYSVNGGDTYFCNSTTNCASIGGSAVVVGAKGGLGAINATGAQGGATSTGVATGTGSVKYKGGNGGTGNGRGDSGGGGGGAAGPNGNGGNGGDGNSNTTYGHGGGGGGNGGGANGASVSGNPPSPNQSGAGGNNYLNTGGGAGVTSGDGTNGTAGGGGAGGFDSNDGGNGGDGQEWGEVGSGGGGGGTGDTSSTVGYGGDAGFYGAGGGGGLIGGRGAPGIIIITYGYNQPTKTIWTVPSDWNNASNTIEVIGAGGAGYTAVDSGGAAAGGGGGYSKSINVSLTANTQVAYQIGNGGRKNGRGSAIAGLSGGDTYFCNATSNCTTIAGSAVRVGAKGGTGGTSATTGGRTGGAAASGVAYANEVLNGSGSQKYSGGTGGAGTGTGDNGGGGGGAAGPNGNAGAGGSGTNTATYGGGGGGGAGGTACSGSPCAGSGPNTTTGGAGGNGPAGTGGGAGGNPGQNGGSGTGGGAGGGNNISGGGFGGSGSEWTIAGAGGGGGGVGDNSGAETTGGNGGLFGAGGGGGKWGGWGANGLIVITYVPAVFSQSAYRFFNNTNSTVVGAPFTTQNTTTTIPYNSQFRLRILIHVADAPLGTSGRDFKLQFVDMGTGTCAAPSGGSPSSYTDVTSTTAIAYFNNPTPVDGDALTSTTTDPTHSGHSLVNQTYEEANNFTNSQSQIDPDSYDGLWDFSLDDYNAEIGKTYCFRAVEANSKLLSSYNIYPAVTFINFPPTITSATDAPDPVNAGSNITFTVDWSDENADNTRSFICKTNSFTSSTLTCPGGAWASSTSFATTDPVDMVYTTQVADGGTNNYYAFTCDNDNACSSGSPGTFTVNRYPSITSVNDAPDPVNAGSNITFTVDWSDADAGDLTRSFICKTNSFTSSTLTCDGGWWSSSTAFATTDPVDVIYTTQGGDIGTNNYYAFTCDNDNACSSGSPGTFDVNSGNSAPTINSATDYPDPVSVGSAVTFTVNWSDADTGDLTRTFICKTNSFTSSTLTCDGGSWASSTSFSSINITEVFYTALLGDLGTKNYFAFVCDDSNACSNGSAGTFTVVKSAPIINSVIDAPDPVVASNNITFTVNWTDPEGDNARSFICKTNVITTSTLTCPGGWYASSTSMAATNPVQISYTAQAGDAGPRSYYAFVCDSDNKCSTATVGSFLVNLTSSVSGYIEGIFNILGDVLFR